MIPRIYRKHKNLEKDKIRKNIVTVKWYNQLHLNITQNFTRIS